MYNDGRIEYSKACLKEKHAKAKHPVFQCFSQVPCEASLFIFSVLNQEGKKALEG